MLTFTLTLKCELHLQFSKHFLYNGLLEILRFILGGIHPSINPSIHLSIYLSLYLSLCLSIYLSIYPLLPFLMEFLKFFKEPISLRCMAQSSIILVLNILLLRSWFIVFTFEITNWDLFLKFYWSTCLKGRSFKTTGEIPRFRSYSFKMYENAKLHFFMVHTDIFIFIYEILKRWFFVFTY